MISPLHGMMAGRHVSDVLAGILRLCSCDCVAVIRSIDSASSQDDLARSLAFHSVPHDVVNGNVCVSIGDLQIALGADVFSGFDEIWITLGGPPSIDLRHLPGATSDATDFSGGIPGELRDAMARANCTLVIGDGCGLNFATTDESIHREIMKAET